MQPSHVDVLGHRMAYRRSGSGRDVLFLHGNPTSSLLWADVVADLSDAYRCTSVDLIGMGDSDRLPGTGDARYAFAEHARYLDAALRALGLDRDVVLVGHDWGGVLAVDRARRHPGTPAPSAGWRTWRRVSSPCRGGRGPGRTRRCSGRCGARTGNGWCCRRPSSSRSSCRREPSGP